MQAYSMDLRQRVLADSDAGMQTKPLAEKYGVSRTWVRSLKQRRRETGEIAPRVGGGRKPKFDRARLAALVNAQLVVMDNLSSYKGVRTRQLIHAANADRVYLPPYSPDLNPIAMAFSKLKQRLRSLACRSVEQLWTVMQSVLDRVSPTDAEHFFDHCGYATYKK